MLGRDSRSIIKYIILKRYKRSLEGKREGGGKREKEGGKKGERRQRRFNFGKKGVVRWSSRLFQF